MNRYLKPVFAAASLAILQSSSVAFAATAPVPPASASPLANRPPLAIQSTDDWISYAETTFTPVADEVSRCLRAAGDAFDAKDNAKAPTELDHIADSVASGPVKREHALDREFTRADKALAPAHRELATKSWDEKKYDEVGYEMKAGAQALDDAAT